jgi:tRNA(Ile)-lysidine synthase
LTRNRVRHVLMPMLRSFNPVVDEMLANVAELARDEQAYWEAEVGRLLPHLLLPGKPVRGGGRAVGTAAGEAAVALELERLRGLGAAMRRRVVRAAARSVGCRLSFDETAKLLALAGFGGYEGVKGKVGSKLELRGGLRAERSARELRLWRTFQV